MGQRNLLSTVEQAKRIDLRSQTEFNLPGDILMEGAGSAAAAVIAQAFFPEISQGQILVICGPGNNGGDGLVVARHLFCHGFRNIKVLIDPRESLSSPLSPLCTTALERLKKLEIKLDMLGADERTFQEIDRSTLIVDALYGIGLVRPIEGFEKEIIEYVNKKKTPVVSLDLPSGLQGDTGEILGAAFKATMTLTFGLRKPGFFIGAGPEHIGKLRELPISFPPQLIKEEAKTHFILTSKIAKKLLPKRKRNSNKSDHGRGILVAGSEGKWGAGILACRAAYRVGAGYVIYTSFEDPTKIIGKFPEALTMDIDTAGCNPDWVYGVGPGLEPTEEVANIIRRLKDVGCKKVLLDAGALFACQKYNLFPVPDTWILTPHTGELSRLIDVSRETLESDRCYWAMETAKRLGGIHIMKGHHTVIAEKDRCMIIPTGNAALAKAGSGDVLAGMITGLMAQGLTTQKAAALGAYLHGRIADQWIREGNDQRSLNSSDMLLEISKVLKLVSQGL